MSYFRGLIIFDFDLIGLSFKETGGPVGQNSHWTKGKANFVLLDHFFGKGRGYRTICIWVVDQMYI